jgi:hypothetical protein
MEKTADSFTQVCASNNGLTVVYKCASIYNNEILDKKWIVSSCFRNFPENTEEAHAKP